MKRLIILGMLLGALSGCTDESLTGPSFEDQAPGKFWFGVWELEPELVFYQDEYDTKGRIEDLFRDLDFGISRDCEKYLINKVRIWESLGHLELGSVLVMDTELCSWHWEYETDI